MSVFMLLCNIVANILFCMVKTLHYIGEADIGCTISFALLSRQCLSKVPTMRLNLSTLCTEYRWSLSADTVYILIIQCGRLETTWNNKKLSYRRDNARCG